MEPLYFSSFSKLIFVMGTEQRESSRPLCTLPFELHQLNQLVVEACSYFLRGPIIMMIYYMLKPHFSIGLKPKPNCFLEGGGGIRLMFLITLLLQVFVWHVTVQLPFLLLVFQKS